MRATGIEPARPCGHGILSPARLPVPPRPRTHIVGIAPARPAFRRLSPPLVPLPRGSGSASTPLPIGELTMPSTRPGFASLGLAPLILRLVLGATILWSGLGKWYSTISVQGDDAALLVNLGVLDRPTTPAPAPTPAPAKPLPTPGALLILAQSTTPTKPIPVTAGPAILTGADFPDPVSCRALWRIAAAVHRAAHPTPDPFAKPSSSSYWPKFVGDGLWPKWIAIAVLIAEIGGGLMLLLGLFTRLAALAAAAVMLGSIWINQIGPAINSGQTLLGFLPAHDPWDTPAWMPLGWKLALLACALALLMLGCGVLALDRAIAGYRDVPERFKRPAPTGAPSAPK